VPKSKYDQFQFIPFERRRRYHAMVSFMDDAVGNLVDDFKKKALWGNTIMGKCPARCTK
jgi:arylsulfatase A-like enzyme